MVIGIEDGQAGVAVGAAEELVVDQGRFAALEIEADGIGVAFAAVDRVVEQDRVAVDHAHTGGAGTAGSADDRVAEEIQPAVAPDVDAEGSAARGAAVQIAVDQGQVGFEHDVHRRRQSGVAAIDGQPGQGDGLLARVVGDVHPDVGGGVDPRRPFAVARPGSLDITAVDGNLGFDVFGVVADRDENGRIRGLGDFDAGVDRLHRRFHGARIQIVAAGRHENPRIVRRDQIRTVAILVDVVGGQLRRVGVVVIVIVANATGEGRHSNNSLVAKAKSQHSIFIIIPVGRPAKNR